MLNNALSLWRLNQNQGGAFPGSTLDMNFARGSYLGATPSNLTVTRASGGYAETVAGTLTYFGNNVARITDKGLLVEEGRTNSWNYSQDISQGAWAKENMTVSASSVAAPDGTLTAWNILTPTSAALPHRLIQISPATAIGTVYTVSAFVRNDTDSRYFQIAFASTDFGATAYANFDTTNGTVTVTGAGLTNASITRFTNGWWRITVSSSATAIGTGGAFITRIPDASSIRSPNWAGNNEIWQVWGGQWETGAFPTSYIPTTAVAVARQVDSINLQGANFTPWFTGGASGSLYVEGLPTAPVGVAGTFRNWASLDDGVLSEAHIIFESGAGRGLIEQTFDGGVGQTSISSGVAIYNTIFKSAVGYATNNVGFTTEGTTVTTDLTATMPTPTSLRFGTGVGFAIPANGYIRRVAYFPSRLSDDELSILTLTDPTLDMNFAAGQYVGATPSSLTVTRASTGYAEDTSGNWTSFSSNVARITNKGLLVEEGRTNLIPNSAGTGGTIGAVNSNPTGWDGFAGSGLTRTFAGRGVENGMDYVDFRYTGTTTNSFIVHAFANPAIATTAASVYTLSVFYKLVAGAMPAGNFGIQFRYNGGGDPAPGTNLTTPDSTWRRGTYALAAPASTVSCFPAWYTNSMPVGVAVDFTIRFAWPQLELGASATSPIRTTAGAVARAADAVSLSGGNFTSWFTGGSSGTMYAEVIPDLNQTNGFPGYFAVDDGTTNNFLQILMNNAGNNSSYEGTSGGVAQFGLGGTVLSAANNKFALAYATNDAAASTNGSAVSTDASVTVPTGLTTARLGSLRAGSNIAVAYIRRVRYWPTRLANNVLQRIST